MGCRIGSFVLGALGIALWLHATRDARADGGFVILVNQGNGTTSLSRSEIRRLITGGIKQWENGAVVQLGVIPSEAPETRYLASLIDATARELLSRIQGQVFNGELRRPVVLHSSADCVAFARASAGALCVASEREVVPPDARVVAVR